MDLWRNVRVSFFPCPLWLMPKLFTCSTPIVAVNLGGLHPLLFEILKFPSEIFWFNLCLSVCTSDCKVCLSRLHLYHIYLCLPLNLKPYRLMHLLKRICLKKYWVDLRWSLCRYFIYLHYKWCKNQIVMQWIIDTCVLVTK